MEWSGSDYRYEYTYEHWIYLRLPNSLQQGMDYTLEIASATNSDTASAAFTFDIYSSRSEAIHVNLVGYAPDTPHKAADLYYWLGSGGARGYSSFEGNTVYIYNVSTGASQPVGLVNFWKTSEDDVFSYNLTGSEVMWEFSGRVYDYRVEVSTNGSTWTTMVDKTDNSSTAQTQNDPFIATARYVRITVTGLPSSTWASFYEFRVFGW